MKAVRAQEYNKIYHSPSRMLSESLKDLRGLPWLLSGKGSTCQCRRHGFGSWSERSSGDRNGISTLVFLPGRPNGQRILVGYSSWGHKELDTTYQLNNNVAFCLMVELQTLLCLLIQLTNITMQKQHLRKKSISLPLELGHREPCTLMAGP